jgi:sigma-B regulation protein RsbU (phosphoserine phosphatase)
MDIKILLINDKSGEADLLKELLSADPSASYDTTCINRGYEAFEYLEHGRVDCILLDCRLPDMTGIEFLERFAGMIGHHGIPVVFLTGSGAEASALEAMKKGASDYIIKDLVNASSLRRSIKYSIEKKLSEKKQREQQELINTIIDNIPNPVFYKDRNRVFLGCNKSYEAFFGVPKSELTGKTAYDVFEEEFAAMLDQMDAEILFRKAPVSRDFKLRTPDGDERNIIINNAPYMNAAGEVSGVVAVITDITERKKTENELRKLVAAVEKSPSTVVITDSKGNIEYVNPKFTRLTGYSFEEAMGANPRILKSGEQPAEYYSELWETISAGRDWHGEFHNKKKNGEMYWELASISPILDEEGKIVNYIAVKEDITERKNAEIALKIREEDLSRKNDIMEKDLELAQITQNALLHMEIPELDFIRIDYRYKPLGSVGGDFFNFYPYIKDGFAFFIGDVSGHGVSSALFLSLIKSSTDRIFRKHAESPSEYISALNRDLKGFMTSHFITGIYGIMRKSGETKSLTLANGGHPYPVIIRSNGDIEIIKSGGTLIGILDDGRYIDFTVEINSGDRIFVFTDGIPETENDKGEMIGFEEGLADLFKSSVKDDLSDYLDEIMRRVIEFRSTRPPGDDIIIIGFEIL